MEITDEDAARLRTSLRLPESADGPAIMTALAERLAQPATALQLPEGFVPIERATLDTLQSNAQAGREARDEQQRVEREQLVETAIRDGRISPASRASYLTQLTPVGDGSVATQVREVLAALPKGVVPVSAAVGYTGATGGGGDVPQDSVDDVRKSDAYSAWRF